MSDLCVGFFFLCQIPVWTYGNRFVCRFRDMRVPNVLYKCVNISVVICDTYIPKFRENPWMFK